MKKIVLLAINAKYVHSSLSSWIIAEGVSRFFRFPHEVIVAEATVNQSYDIIINHITEHSPDVIGISSYIWNAGMMPRLLVMLRERLPDLLIVLGGPEASNNVDYWLENGADYVLEGEGEFEFPRFLNNLYCAQDSFAFADAACKFINPYTDSYLNALNGRLSYIETSRGCPFQCSFCLSADSGVKYFPLENVKEQIKMLSQANTKTVKFVDRTFNCNSDRAYEIFEYILGLKTECRFHFEVAADLFDERILLLLEAAPPGRIQFEIGLQSFYEPSLKAVSRQTDIHKAEKNINFLIKKQNIHIHVDLIAGLPYETFFDFQNSFNRAYSLNAHTLQLGFLKFLHGSKLRKQADSFCFEYSDEPPYELICSPWLSVDNLRILKQVENALQHTKNKGRFLSTLHYVLTATGKTPFALFHSMGMSVPNSGTQLEDYIVQLYDFFIRLPGVDKIDLKDCMIYDWLSMVKGKNIPAFLKNDNKQRVEIAQIAELTLERKIRREEYAVLSSGKGLFVDSNNRDPVTELYEVYVCGCVATI